MRRHNLLLNAGIYIFGSFFVQGLRFITLPFFSRWMSATDYALMSSYESWISIITIIVGLQVTSTINNAYWDYGKEYIKNYVSNISLLGVISGIVVISITWIFRDLLERTFQIDVRYLIIGVVQSLFAFYLTLLTGEYRVREKPWGYFLFSIMNSVIMVGLGMALVWCMPAEKYVGRIYGSLIAAILSGGIASLIIYRVRPRRNTNGCFSYALHLSIPIIFHSFGGIILGKADQIMLLNMVDKKIMGIYSYGTNFAHIIYVLGNACNMAYQPFYYSVKRQKDATQILRINSSYIRIYITSIGGIILLLPEVIKLMSGSAYYRSIYSAPLLAYGFMINFLYTFPVNYEFYKKETRYIAITTSVSAVINILLNYTLIPKYEELGAAVATILSTMMQLLGHFCIAKYRIKDYEMPFIIFAKYLLGILGMIFIYYFFISRPLVRLTMAVIMFAISGLSIKDAISRKIFHRGD